jgi:hypothetical protein
MIVSLLMCLDRGSFYLYRYLCCGGVDVSVCKTIVLVGCFINLKLGYGLPSKKK